MKRRPFPAGIVCLALSSICLAAEHTLPSLEKPVEILRDRWGIPHIYAQSARDLFLAQGWITARDRLFQIDLWRRVNNGHLAEALGPQAVGRDRIARLVRFRGDWNAEWNAYAPDAREIAVAFTGGINAYIDSLGGQWPMEFRAAGYAPSKWKPEDITGRVAGLLMTRNVAREVQRALDLREYGLATVEKLLPTNPAKQLVVPRGLDLRDITPRILAAYSEAIGPVRFPDRGDGSGDGSNNWAVSGAHTVTGKPILASDPHRPIQMPSLRKTVHLSAPGWNMIGAGEPALPGIALGHNEEMGFGFTIVNIDQADLYVEKLNPSNPDEYWHKGGWRKMEVARERIAVRGAPERTVELRFTIHGPVIHEELGRHRAYALKWKGAEPGGAGYLGALSLARARNWEEFKRAAADYKLPSENLVYADRAGNIGWFASGHSPIRKNWDGLLPVPGDSGEFEWSGTLAGSDHPQLFNPASGWVATANHNTLPAGYPHQLGYEFSPPFRYQRIVEMLTGTADPPETGTSGVDRAPGAAKFTVADFQVMQQDVLSIPARRFQAAVRNAKLQGLTASEKPILERFLAWDARLAADSSPAMLFQVWLGKMHALLFGRRLGPRVERRIVLARLESKPDARLLLAGFRSAVEELQRVLGPDSKSWRWGQVHTASFIHPLNQPRLNRGPVARPGDGDTVGAASGANFKQTSGASFRMILDLSDWDKSVMTNVPGESGDPDSPHYADLIGEWASGRYHPMLFSRKAVEAATGERILLLPAKAARP
jgi:penicillin amidase